MSTQISTPEEIADFLLCESRERGDILTNLKLQKLLYYAQAWHLTAYNKALFKENFQAWVHGPVLPSQYHRFKDYRWKPIIDERISAPNLNKKLIGFLNIIIDNFGIETATALELMTHNELPWIEARKGIAHDAPSKSVISQKSMKAYYSSL